MLKEIGAHDGKAKLPEDPADKRLTRAARRADIAINVSRADE